MINLKRFICSLLIVSLISSLVPARALAEETDAGDTARSSSAFSGESLVTAFESDVAIVPQDETDAAVPEEPDASAPEAPVLSSLSGRVITSEGSGAAGVTVQLCCTDDGALLPPYLTDGSGAWTSAEGDVVAGYTYVVSYCKDGCTFSENDIQVTAQEGGTLLPDVTVSLPAADSTTSGEDASSGGSAAGSPLFTADGLVCNPADYTYNVSNESAVITKYSGSDTAIQLPAELDGYPVTAIGKNAFQYNTTIERLSIPAPVASIGDSAFAGCYNLTEIQFPDGLTTIGGSAFKGCSALTSAQLPNSVTSIGAWAFQNCAQLSSFSYPKDWTTAGGFIFSRCSRLTSVTVPDGVTVIPASAFYTADGLTSIFLPDTVTAIGQSAFTHCTALTSVRFPAALSSIGQEAFLGCTRLSRVDLPDSVNSIGSGAFWNCTRLSYFRYPRSWASAGTGIFHNCSSLASVTIPEGVSSIPAYAFFQAPALRSVSLPSSLTAIGSSAFLGCSQLESVSLPEAVTSVGNSAFSGCTNLRYVLVGNPTLRFNTSVFSSSPSVQLGCNLYSMATVFAIDNQFPFIPSDAADAFPEDVVSRTASRYVADSSAVSINGYATFTIDYSAIEGRWGAVSDQSLTIRIPANTELAESTLKLDDQLCTSYTAEGKVLTIPIANSSGSVKFSATVTGQGDLQSYVLLSYKENGQKKQDIVGVINDPLESFTLNADELTDSPSLRIDGIAPPSATISVYVGDTPVATLTANRSGDYSGTISLGEGIADGAYVIQATCTGSGGETLSASRIVSYQANAPTLTGFRFYPDYANGDSGRAVDLYGLANSGIRPSITHTRKPYKFEVEFTNSASIESVYITSTRSNIKKSIPAKYDPDTDSYVAIGYFDEKVKSYVPGTLRVEYTLKHEEAQVNENMDWDALFSQLSSELISNAKVTSESTSDGSLQGTVDLSKVSESLTDTIVKYAISSYDDAAKTTLEDYLDLSKTEKNIFAYIVPGVDEKRYWTVLDFRDPETYTMIVADAADAADGFAKMTLAMADVGDAGYTKLFDLSSNLSNFSKAAGVIYKSAGIYSDYEDLCSEIMQSSSIQDKAGALDKAAELRNDQIMFTVITTLLPLVVASSGGTMVAPALLFTAMVGVMTSLSDVFWEARVSEIKGTGYKINWHIDPSGYVYDTDTGLRLEGVTTTVYCVQISDTDGDEFWAQPPTANGAEMEALKWNASECSQENPLITDAEGRYAWDVPEGWWRVKYEKEGYVTTWSDWLSVPPPQTEVNIGMTPLASSDYRLTLSESSATSATVSLTNLADSGASLVYVLAAYSSDGRMVAYSTVTETALAPSGSTSLTVAYAAEDAVTTVRAYVLDAATKAPLRPSWTAIF